MLPDVIRQRVGHELAPYFKLVWITFFIATIIVAFTQCIVLASLCEADQCSNNASRSDLRWTH